MVRPQVTDRKPRDRGPPSHAFTIQEFCDAHRFSRAHYYNLKRLGRGPDETAVGDRIIITIELAQRWRKQHTAASKRSPSNNAA